jgi:hypothetical protein
MWGMFRVTRQPLEVPDLRAPSVPPPRSTPRVPRRTPRPSRPFVYIGRTQTPCPTPTSC